MMKMNIRAEAIGLSTEVLKLTVAEAIENQVRQLIYPKWVFCGVASKFFEPLQQFLARFQRRAELNRPAALALESALKRMQHNEDMVNIEKDVDDFVLVESSSKSSSANLEKISKSSEQESVGVPVGVPCASGKSIAVSDSHENVHYVSETGRILQIAAGKNIDQHCGMAAGKDHIGEGVLFLSQKKIIFASKRFGEKHWCWKGNKKTQTVFSFSLLLLNPFFARA